MSESEEMTDKTVAGPESQEKQIAIKVDEVLYRIVEDHIKALMRLEKGISTRNEWLQTALKAKLERENILSANSIPKEKHITVRLGKPLQDALERRVSILGGLTRGYSKKRFFIEAIFEKIEQEKEFVAKTFQERQSDKDH